MVLLLILHHLAQNFLSFSLFLSFFLSLSLSLSLFPRDRLLWFPGDPAWGKIICWGSSFSSHVILYTFISTYLPWRHPSLRSVFPQNHTSLYLKPFERVPSVHTRARARGCVCVVCVRGGGWGCVWLFWVLLFDRGQVHNLEYGKLIITLFRAF